eukprot:CAMPEP_0172556500 /NCGR_PEP_ID=MMETSP1067-20121228/66683_1 /TAXON_ID=265564 ORGANISM="Thalassiosira punctigera, Strain Tpunct2005C2" /NCGR_SAMPLE_ID=MMETSP1067 /ASSEMBLY_ACC=CAM_ASM_000444 /LENGTH=38 /DNA_ID= /DNA_START= /DNA_END= /DNA_ORIENTATION=
MMDDEGEEEFDQHLARRGDLFAMARLRSHANTTDASAA